MLETVFVECFRHYLRMKCLVRAAETQVMKTSLTVLEAAILT